MPTKGEGRPSDCQGGQLHTIVSNPRDKQAARSYLALGFSVIPVRPGDKRPALGSWKDYQSRYATAEELTQWFRGGSNIGIVTGMISGLVVVDVDGPEGESWFKARGLPDTPTVKTARGYHLYFEHPGYEMGNRAGVVPGIDIRGDGGYVVAPPSVHASGHAYEWMPGKSTGDVDPLSLPGWILALIRDDKSEATPRRGSDWRELARDGATTGSRNHSVASLAGHLLARRVDPFVTLDLIRAWNATRNVPPLSDREIQETVNSIAGAELSKRRGGNGRR